MKWISIEMNAAGRRLGHLLAKTFQFKFKEKIVNRIQLLCNYR